MSLKRLQILFVIVLVASCGDDRDSNSVVEFTDASLPGVYAGTFPCDGCAGIETVLWLRADKRFFFQQRYLADDTQQAMDAYNLGRWSNVGDDREIVLAGAGPARTFMRLDRDVLIMLTDSELEHRLIRDPGAPEFSATIRMAGIMRMHGDGTSFTECLTGLVAPVSRGGDFARFRHQYRSVGGRSKPAYVELEGRFSWSDDGRPKSLTITQFSTIKANGAC